MHDTGETSPSWGGYAAVIQPACLTFLLTAARDPKHVQLTCPCAVPTCTRSPYLPLNISKVTTLFIIVTITHL